MRAGQSGRPIRRTSLSEDIALRAGMRMRPRERAGRDAWACRLVGRSQSPSADIQGEAASLSRATQELAGLLSPSASDVACASVGAGRACGFPKTLGSPGSAPPRVRQGLGRLLPGGRAGVAFDIGAQRFADAAASLPAPRSLAAAGGSALAGSLL